MEVLYRICAALDVHAKTVVACLNQKGKKEIRTFSTMTDDLLALTDWLVETGCQPGGDGVDRRLLEAGV